jgi:Family of unknown function (DUF5996)
MITCFPLFDKPSVPPCKRRDPSRVLLSPPVFYSYAYPEPPGFSETPVKPDAAFYSSDFREFILAYDVVRQSESPDDTLLEFLQTTYEAAANLAKWDRALLERDHGPKSLLTKRKAEAR